MQLKLLLNLLAFAITLNSLLAQKKIAFQESLLWLNNNIELVSGDKLDSQEKLSYFNFNPVIDVQNQQSDYPNILTEYFSIFVVFKSSSKANTPVLELSTKRQKIQVNSNSIYIDRDVAFEESDPTKGTIISYKGRFEKYSRKNNLSFIDFFQQIKEDSQNNHLIEVLYFPKFLNTLETIKIESYLSLKYGISLMGNKDYINSKRDTIWSQKRNKDFKYRITGLGRDDQTQLYQKQTKNTSTPEMSVGLSTIAEINSKNDSEIPDNSFILWGDNNKSIEFSTNPKLALNKLDRVWKIQSTSTTSSFPLNLEIKLDSTFLKNNYESFEFPVWLAMSATFEDDFDLNKSDYYPSSIDENGDLIFNNISFEGNNEQSQYFTFFKAAPFFVESAITQNCGADNSVRLDLYGGQPPFTIEVGEIVQQNVYEREIDILIDSGSYTLNVTDDLNQSFTNEILIEDTKLPSIRLSPIWELGANNEVEVIPFVQEENASDLTYTWYQGETIVSNKMRHTFRSTGNFELSVKNETGCEIRYPIEISKDALGANGSDVLFPNPVQSGDPFTLAMSLQNPSEITLNLFNVNGQLLSSEILPKTSTVNYQHSFLSSGTYFIAITTNKGSKTYKVLVR